MITVPETTGGWKAETGRGTEAEEKDEWEESKAGSWETLQGQTLQQHNLHNKTFTHLTNRHTHNTTQSPHSNKQVYPHCNTFEIYKW